MATGERDKKVILLVEHDSRDRALYASALQSAGHQVLACPDAVSALKSAASAHPDVIITRVLLPDLDGFEMVGKICGAGLKCPALIVMSVLKDNDTRARAAARGAVYLAKPLAPETLLAELARLVASRTPLKKDAHKKEDFSLPHFIDFLASRGRVGPAARARLAAARPVNMRGVAATLGLPLSELTPLAAEHLGLDLAGEIKMGEVVPGVLSAVFSRTNKVLILNRGDHYVAVCDPFDSELISSLYSAFGGKYPLMLAEEEAVAGVMREGLDATRAERSAEISASSGFDSDAIDDAHPVAKMSAELLYEAAVQGASDVHIEPGPANASVRFRVDGMLRTVLKVRRDVGARLVTRFKAMASLDVANSLRPQDGSFEIKIAGRMHKVRLATVDAGAGEAAVLRLLDPKATPPDLEQLGFAPEQAAAMGHLAGSPTGLLIFAGPTGSGKTTSIRSFLTLIGTSRYSIVTVEDPIEYELPGAKQLQVNDRTGAGLDALLKSVVRLDPDVLFMGEIRDASTAKTALDFASTGHFTVATIHASSAEEVPYRLARLGVEPRIVSEQVVAVVAQRLVPRLCPSCLRKLAPSAEQAAALRSLGHNPELLGRSPGCHECHMTGIKGREVIAEVLFLDQPIRELVASSAGKDRLLETLNARPGYLTLARHAAMKVAAGRVAFEAAFEQVSEPEKEHSEAEKKIAQEKGKNAGL